MPEQPPMEAVFTSYLSIYPARVFSARSASVSHLSAISIKNDLCTELRAASANRMHSAALLRNWTKLSKCASISVHMGTDRALCPRMILDPSAEEARRTARPPIRAGFSDEPPAPPVFAQLQYRAERRERLSHLGRSRRLRRRRSFDRSEGKHADDPWREADH